MQHHPQMSTATKVELELARQRAEKAMAGETGLQQTWRGLPRQPQDRGALCCPRRLSRCIWLQRCTQPVACGCWGLRLPKGRGVPEPLA